MIVKTWPETGASVEMPTRCWITERFRPAAIVLTHAHPDPAGGLGDGAASPVYATDVVWAAIGRYPIERREVVAPRRPYRVGSFRLEAFPVEHSLRAPAVGYRIEAGRAEIFYAPDLGRDPRPPGGAGRPRPLRRWRRRDHPRDHPPAGRQGDRPRLHPSPANWCAANHVPRAVFTHCGSEIVKGDAPAVAARVEALGRRRSVRARLPTTGSSSSCGRRRAHSSAPPAGSRLPASVTRMNSARLRNSSIVRAPT